MESAIKAELYETDDSAMTAADPISGAKDVPSTPHKDQYADEG